jgi:pimeloyl-ACP methyl ester carboxylesterase
VPGSIAAAGVPGARLVTVPDAGHLFNWEGADALVDAVTSFQQESGLLCATSAP